MDCIVRSFTHAGRAHDYVKFLHAHGVSSAWIEIRYWRRGKGRQRPRIGAYDILIAQTDMDLLGRSPRRNANGCESGHDSFGRPPPVGRPSAQDDEEQQRCAIRHREAKPLNGGDPVRC